MKQIEPQSPTDTYPALTDSNLASYNSDDCRNQDNENRVELFKRQNDRYGKNTERNVKMRRAKNSCAQALRKEHRARKRKQRRRYQSDHSRFQAIHRTDDELVAFEFLITPRNDQNDHKRRKYHAERCTQAPEYSAGSCAYKGSDIYRERSRRALAYGYKIDQLTLIQPAVCRYFLLNHRQHGIAAAKREQSDFQKGEEQIKVNHHLSLLPVINVGTIPAAAQNSITKTTLTGKNAVTANAPNIIR